MASTPVHVYLGTLQVDTTGGGAWADVGQCTKFKPPQMKVGAAKTTYLQQSTRWHTYIPGWVEPGSVTFTMNMRTADFNLLFVTYLQNTDSAGSSVRNWRIRYNDGSGATTGSVLSFSGYVEEMGDDELSRDQDLPVMTSGSIKVSGKPTYTQAT